jgi:hypothetical protein
MGSFSFRQQTDEPQNEYLEYNYKRKMSFCDQFVENCNNHILEITKNKCKSYKYGILKL